MTPRNQLVPSNSNWLCTKGQWLALLVRAMLFYFIVVLCGIGYGISAAIFFFFPQRVCLQKTMLYPRLATFCIPFLLGIRYRVINAHRLQQGRPCIYVSNHQSAYEIFVLGPILLYPACFVLKRELLYLPFIGWGFWASGMIAVTRGTPQAREKVLTMGLKRLAAGFNICLFPEGTRMPVGQRGPYKSSAMAMAIAAQRPIVPIVHNAGSCWPKRSFLKSPGQVTFIIGPVITSQGKTLEQLREEVETWTDVHLQHLENERHRLPGTEHFDSSEE